MGPQPLNASYPDGFLKATSQPPTCIQIPGGFTWTEPSTSEDCLYLDVYTPHNATTSSALPVKVWAYGGGNTYGALDWPLYDACNLATDAVVVKFNYRLGPLGFLGLESAGIDGNMAIKDYLAALNWVQENIAAFGGDIDQVMLFGQSAGAANTFIVSTLPHSKSLMRAAIAESATQLELPKKETCQGVGARYAAALNCSATDLACLQSKTSAELVRAVSHVAVLTEGVGTLSSAVDSSWAVPLPNTTRLSWAFVDGKFITQQPLDVGPRVPIVLGNNERDGTFFALPPILASSGSISERNYTYFLSQFGAAASSVAKRYPWSRYNSTGDSKAALGLAVSDVLTDANFACTTYRALRSAMRANMTAYAYRFNHTPSCPWVLEEGRQIPSVKDLPILGATHTAEIPFVFGNVNGLPFGNGSCNLSPAEDRLSQTMRNAWTAMAAAGDPTTSDLTWPTFDCSARGIFIQQTADEAKLDFSKCNFWDTVWASMGGVVLALPDAADCRVTGVNATTNAATAPQVVLGVAVAATLVHVLGALM